MINWTDQLRNTSFIYHLCYYSQGEKYQCRINIVSSPNDVQDGHWYFSIRGKYQCRIDTVSSSDDGHIVARNMYRSCNKYTKV